MKKIFRISEWKDTHLLLIYTCFFLWINYFERFNFELFILDFTFLVTITLLLGSFGYYINDVFDVKQDEKVNKKNFAAKHSKITRIIIPLTLIVFTFLSWHFLNKQQIILYVLLLEIGLFFIYSLPQIRFKEKPILSIVIDALYAYVIWGVINYLLVQSWRGGTDFKLVSPFILYILWLFFIGMRGILSHHVTDYQNDLRTKTKTFATYYGLDKTIILQKLIFAPIELLLFFVFLFIIYQPLAYIYFLYILLSLLYYRKEIINDFYLKQELNLISILIDKFYYSWLPISSLILLSTINIQYLLFSIAFAILYIKQIKSFFTDLYKLLYRWIFIAGSFIVNYSLYYSFLLVGIDLKKRAALKASKKKIAIDEKKIKTHENIYAVLSNIKENNVHGLWIGNKLSNMELLTIHSFIKHGYNFHLWTYEKLVNELPKQVILCDANEIISSEKIFTYKHKSQFGNGQGSVAGFSDIFRYKLLYEKGGWWVDMDITCLTPFDVDAPYFFRAHNSLDVVGNIIKVPAKSSLMKMCYEQAIQTIDENNNDWHKPIQILNDNIKTLNLSSYIFDDLSNTDEFNRFEKYYFSEVEIPKNWRFIHWNNEILRIYGVNKEHSYYDSTYSKLLREFNLMPLSKSPKEIDKNYKRHLTLVNLKKTL